MSLFYSSVILVEGGEKCSSFQPKPRDGVIPLQTNQTSGAPRGWLLALGIPIRRGCRQLTPRWAFADLQSSPLPALRTDWGTEEVCPGELGLGALEYHV